MFFPRSQEADSPSCTELIKQWWTTVPFFNRAIFWGCTGIYILSWFFPSIDVYGINTPSFTIEKFQLWRIFTACFVHLQLLQLFFCLISLLPSSTIIERQLGSTLFIMNIIAEAILIQSIFAIISFLLSLFIQIEEYTFYSAGLWSLVMVYISLKSFANPEQETNFLCFPIQIKQKYYPWLILIIFSIFSMFQIIDLFCGILVGYIEFKYFNSCLIKLSDQKLQLYEDKYFQSVKNNATYIDVHKAGSDTQSQILQQQQQQAHQRDLQSQQQIIEEQRNQPSFGGTGTIIGANRPVEVQSQIDEFHRERIEAQQRRLQALQQAQGTNQQQQQQEKQKQENKNNIDLQPFSGKGISLEEENKKQKQNYQGYINLAEESNIKEEEERGDFI